jgi:hypothetical protein
MNDADALLEEKNRLAIENRQLRLELAGEERARFLLLAGMESQAALMDGLKQEVRRLLRGEFTAEEFQALCHHRDERPGCTRAEFEAGCREYQDKLFGTKGDGR